MRHARIAALAAALLAACGAAAVEPAKVQGRFARDGKTYAVTHALAWQSARPDVLILVLSDGAVDLMDARHPLRLKQLAEEGQLRGLHFEFDPARLDAKWVSGRFMTPDWSTYRGGMGSSWKKLAVANGRIAGQLDAGGVQLDFQVPITGGAAVKTLTGEAAWKSPQVDALIRYETAVRNGKWQEAVKYLTPLSAEVLQREVATPHGLGQFQTAGKYMKDFLAQGEARRREIQKVVVSGDDAAVIGDAFAAEFVRIDGRWRKI
jgi:hypothetical protein